MVHFLPLLASFDMLKASTSLNFIVLKSNTQDTVFDSILQSVFISNINFVSQDLKNLNSILVSVGFCDGA